MKSRKPRALHLAISWNKSEKTYPVELLRDWKTEAEQRAGIELHRPLQQDLCQKLTGNSYEAEIEDLKNANLRVELSECLDAKSTHKEWKEAFPDPDNVRPSSHFQVANNDRLWGTAFSGNLDDWCFCIVSLKKDREDVVAYSDIILRILGNQDDQTWIFYGHKVLAELEAKSGDRCSSPPYYMHYKGRGHRATSYQGRGYKAQEKR